MGKKERSRGAVFGLVSLRSCAPSLSEERERERERETKGRETIFSSSSSMKSSSQLFFLGLGLFLLACTATRVAAAGQIKEVKNIEARTFAYGGGKAELKDISNRRQEKRPSFQI